jgi:hypothetical protein
LARARHQLQRHDPRRRRLPNRPVEPERVGDVGIGKGGAAIPQTPTAPTMSSLIRAEFDLRRQARAELARHYDRNLQGEAP